MASLRGAAKHALMAFAQELGINGTHAMTKQEISNSIWAATRRLIARVNEGQVSDIALASWVGLCWGAFRAFAGF